MASYSYPGATIVRKAGVPFRKVGNWLDDLGGQLSFYGKAIAWTPQTLRKYRKEVIRLLAEVSLDQSFEHEEYGPLSIRWLIVHMIEEYGRHCGHADLIRESIDGMTGE